MGSNERNNGNYAMNPEHKSNSVFVDLPAPLAEVRGVSRYNLRQKQMKLYNVILNNFSSEIINNENNKPGKSCLKFIAKSVQNYTELNNLDMLDMNQIRAIHRAFTLQN